jgi:hypothetical protein
MRPPLCGELIQGDIVLDVFRDERAVLFWHGAEVDVRKAGLVARSVNYRLSIM